MIPVRNIYYMLSYAFYLLNEKGYRSIATEQFDNVADLCAAILSKGVSIQIKRGISREYIEETEARSSICGRIEISESVKTRTILRNQLICSYDSFSANTYLNRIIKTTLTVLLRADITQQRKKDIRRVLVFLENIDCLDINTINWNVRVNRNTQSYRMLISICYLVINGLLQTEVNGATRVMEFFDEQSMSRLYEKFILGYYAKECPYIKATSSQIPWAVDDGNKTMLPIMQSDVMLTRGSDVLIIDAKYYSHTTQKRYDAHTLQSANLYQIFTYVKNKEASFGKKAHRVSGMLLYAATDEAVQPNCSYVMSGNKISVQTLDLNQDFSEIASHLNSIVNEYFPY